MIIVLALNLVLQIVLAVAWIYIAIDVVAIRKDTNEILDYIEDGD